MRWFSVLIFILITSSFASSRLPSNTLPLAGVALRVSTYEQLDFTVSSDIVNRESKPGSWKVKAIDGTYRVDRNGLKHPAKLVWIAVPPGKRVQLTSIKPQSTSYLSGTLEPAISDTARSDLLRAMTGSNWIEIGELNTLLGHTVVPVYIMFAVQNGNSIAYSSNIAVSLRFVDITSTQSVDRTQLAPLPDYILNHSTANRWRTSRSSIMSLTQTSTVAPIGPLYRISTNSEGITEITGAELQRAGINLSQIDPLSIRLLSNSAKPLDEALTAALKEPWNEIAILVEDGNDGRFDPTDRILFYGESTYGWSRNSNSTFSHWLSPYTRKATYFLDLNQGGLPGRRMSSLPSANDELLVTTAIGRYLREDDLSCFANASFTTSGTRWVGPLLTNTSDIILTLPLAGAVASPTGIVKFSSRWVSTDNLYPSNGRFLLNGTQFDASSFSYYDIVINNQASASLLHEGANQFTARKTGSHDFYFDWLEVEYPRDLTMRNGKLFADVTIGSKYRVNITTTTLPYVFEVSNRDSVRWIHNKSFADSGSSLQYRRYVAFDEDAFLHVVSIDPARFGGEDYSYLRDTTLSADYLLIYDDDYHDPAKKLRDYRISHNSVDAKMIRIQDIYDCFSGGNVDPVAIRNFLRYTVTSWSRSHSIPKYVMLFGDGDYDYRGILQPNTNRPIPAYEISTYATDDYFTRLTGSTALPEMISARLPLQTPRQMDAWVDKLMTYETQPVPGTWRNKIVLCADDEYGQGGTYDAFEQTHTEKTEDISRRLIPNTYEQVKIYLLEYPAIVDPVQLANVKPEANAALLTELERGALMVNWIGHGNPRVWAHEQLLRESRDLNRINTGMKLPLWLGFTCDWAYWDDAAVQSMPEKLLGLSNNGALAVVAATRPTGADPNEILADYFFRAILDTLQHPHRSIAEALTLAKVQSGTDAPYSRANSSLYTSLCDPLTRLALPEYDIGIDSITPSPITPLARSMTHGKVVIQDGSSLSDGQLTVTLRSSPLKRVHHWDDDPSNSAITYFKPGRLLFRGTTTLTDTSFRTPLLLPLDVTYNDSATAYAYANGSWGAASGILINQRTDSVCANLRDTIPPAIKLFINNREFRSDDIVNDNPILLADIVDSSGVNLTGEIGHRIIATIDGKDLDFTEQFAYMNNQVTKGTVESPLGFLDPGKHHLRLVAFDGANNPGVAVIDFEVASTSSELSVRNLLNYPNPISGNTAFTFECSVAGTASIDIYSIHGTKIRSISSFPIHIGYNYPSEATWDARDKDGVDVANGVYLWRLKAKADDGRSVDATGRAAVLR